MLPAHQQRGSLIKVVPGYGARAWLILALQLRLRTTWSARKGGAGSALSTRIRIMLSLRCRGRWYRAGLLLKQTFAVAHGVAPRALHASLRSVRYDGIGGPISFDTTGRARRAQMIVELTPKNGPGFRLVERIPADESATVTNVH